ncbi:uncharacterized protein LOC143049011 [Mytilus galloprovincialis]|uniref:uncharacterized protein LOC143049011 n=1 Tax=Mytilus galloprovincialis TaxID=29158 RepID=UPI003F7C637F
MADSKAEYGEGQAPMLCQICEITRDIKWKCLDCDLLMCQKCKDKIHPKFVKLAIEHRIVHIKNVGHTEVQVCSCEEEMHFDNIKCTDHLDQKCCLYCKSCDKLICLQCVIKTHKSHIFEDINTGYSIKKDNARRNILTLKEQEETLTTEMEKLETIKEENKLKVSQVNEKITTHEHLVKEKLEKYTQSVKEELNEKGFSIQMGIEEKIAEVNDMRVKIQEKVKITEDLITTKDGNKFFKTCEEIEKSLIDIQLAPNSIETLPTFVPGTLDQSSFGSLKFINGTLVEEDNSCVKVELKIGKEYITPVHWVKNVISSLDGHIWISMSINSKPDPYGLLQKVKPIGSNLEEISNYKIIVHDMIVTPRNDILLCTNDNKIKRFDNTTGELRNSKYNVGSLIPVSICMKDNFIVVGAINNDYPQYGKRLVIEMNHTGRHENKFECDIMGKPIFIYPISLTCTNNARNIFVVDGVSDFCGFRITMLMQDRTIKYYRGHSSVNSFHKQFTPTAILTAPSNNIIVNDMSTNALHILNPCGILCAYIVLSDIGLQRAFSLCCTPKQLFIGCKKVQEKVNDSKKDHPMAKLYELNLKGCTHLV